MKAIALMYHDVVPSAHPESSGFAGADAARYKLTPDQFDDHLQAIRARIRRGGAATSVTPATIDVVDRLGPFSWPLLLTFDDGGGSASRIADVLERHGWRGHFFITTSRIDASNTATASRPDSFAWYIAMSASRIIDSASAPASPPSLVATTTLTVDVSSA